VPALGNVTVCSSPRCNGKIMFATTVKEHQMPVDADPHPEGMLLLGWQGEKLRVWVVPKAEREAKRAEAGGLHRSHFASCVDASYYRRRG
jgi:hypothetical protein